MQCKGCARAMYCGRACQERAWKHVHSRECKILRTGVLDVETDDVKLAVRLFLEKEWTSDRLSAIDLDWTGLRPDELIIPQKEYVLTMSQDRRAARMAMARNGAEKVALALVSGGVPVLQSATPEAVVDYFLSSKCNNFGIWNDLLVPRGAGVYPVGALLNHSCCGNCVMQYGPGNMQIVRAIRPIAAGDELCHSYLDQAAITADRQEVLMRDYNFRCDCERCVPDCQLNAAMAGFLPVVACEGPEEGPPVSYLGMKLEQMPVPVLKADTAVVKRLAEMAALYERFARFDVAAEEALEPLRLVCHIRMRCVQSHCRQAACIFSILVCILSPPECGRQPQRFGPGLWRVGPAT